MTDAERDMFYYAWEVRGHLRRVLASKLPGGYARFAFHPDDIETERKKVWASVSPAIRDFLEHEPHPVFL